GGPAERAPVRLEARAVLAVSSSGAARIAELKKSAEALPATARTPDVAPFRAKVSADLAAQFKGKSAPAAAATRDALLAEARRRFGSDPKTLAGVEKLITDASTVR
ncbi:MAG TPA: hypothetical protein PLB01_17875, partial [Thermoanaerobaculia bacterium]|nr:hypothetical protein [Thermoanaerobaculia bacterium]